MPAKIMQVNRRADGARGGAGFALVLVLLLTTLLSILAVGFSRNARTHSLLARNAVSTIQLRALADAAIEFGIASMIEEGGRTLVHRPLRSYSVEFGSATLEAWISDESGKVDLNAASPEFLRGLLRNLGRDGAGAEMIAGAIVDWRDTGEPARPADMNARKFIATGPRAVSGKGKFRSIEELRQIDGIDEPLFLALAPYVTVHSLTNAVSAFSASAEVLYAIPEIDPRKVARFLDSGAANLRTGNPGAARFPAASAYLRKRQGPVFTVRGRARLPSGARYVRELVVWVQEGQRMIYNRPYAVLESRTTAGADE